MTALWVTLYFAVGAVVFLAIRALYKKAFVPLSAHWGFFTADVVGFLLWPLAAIASLVWLFGEWSATRGGNRSDHTRGSAGGMSS